MSEVVVVGEFFHPAVARRIRRPRWTLAFEFWWLQYRRTWRGSILSTFVYPTLYLASMGLGLGGLVNHHVGTHAQVLGGGSYLEFVTPGILSASAMQIGINEASWPVMGAIRWQRTYLAQIATPIRALDAFAGHLAFIALRLFGTCAVFIGISAAFGAVHSSYALLEILVATLVGLAFATPMAAISAALKNDSAFSTINRLFIVPLFLFSGTFFPVSQLPVSLRVLAEFTPLYNGVALCRALSFGHLAQAANLGHLAYLVAMVTVGVLGARSTYRRRLER